ncbi:unnamed protein product [Phytophthora fragariaefolia]|uniref:Unnamed protein product n=1 Tax=Phytophthora fragariaefolia TaxID=1490495 RepID=A0A9W6XMK5_9STRA|nr:unnamed protein product [Phytophthora fragariaefolia]
MQRLVEQQQASLSAGASVDDLLLLGRLGESDYMDIVHALEDALRHELEDEEEEQELRMAEHMADLEDAELEAMLAGLDLDGQQPQQLQQTPRQDVALLDDFSQDAISVLCPSCKAGYLREHADDAAALPFVSCGCGFTFRVKYVFHSVLEDFQDRIVNAFMAHRHERADEEEPEQPRREQPPDGPEGADVAERGHGPHDGGGGDHPGAVDAPLELHALDVGQVDGQVRRDADVDARADQRHLEEASAATPRVSDLLPQVPRSARPTV